MSGCTILNYARGLENSSVQVRASHRSPWKPERNTRIKALALNDIQLPTNERVSLKKTNDIEIFTMVRAPGDELSAAKEILPQICTEF